MDKRNEEISQEVREIMHRFQHGVFNLQRADDLLSSARKDTMTYIDKNQTAVYLMLFKQTKKEQASKILEKAGKRQRKLGLPN